MEMLYKLRCSVSPIATLLQKEDMNVEFLNPLAQFSGKDRLLTRLENLLDRKELTHIRMAVAFAKSGPLLRLKDRFASCRGVGKSIEAIFGIDHLGTSKQALEFAIANFDKVYVAHTTAHSTFHPKYYLFYGDNNASCLYGSHNLTVGGTETNLEGGVQIDIERPADEAAFEDIAACFEDLRNAPFTHTLHQELLKTLCDTGLLCDENEMSSSALWSEKKKSATKFPFGHILPKPASPLPKEIFATPPAKKGPPLNAVAKKPSDASAQALVLQIVPHHNGEVFLSKIAVNQNPSFFGFPFEGFATPKKPGNPAYPQRTPDPRVNIAVFDKKGNTVKTKEDYALNTIFYEAKAEIRVTFSTDIRTKISPMSIMVMRKAEPPFDYDIEIYNPGSNEFKMLLASCNQTLPSGGAPQARKMGWL